MSVDASSQIVLWRMKLEKTFARATLVESLAQPHSKPHVWLFINAHAFNLMWKRPGYRSHYLAADRVFPDGVGVKLLTRFFCGESSPNLNGTDLFWEIANYLEEHGLGAYYLGAKEERLQGFLQ